MRWGRVLTCALAMALAISPVHGATLQQEYLDIYIKLSDSERLEKVGDLRGALEGFEDCYNRLNKIRRNNPSWEHVLVSSRMEDCKAKIAELEPRVADQGGAPPITPAPAGTGATPGGTPPSASVDTMALKARLQDVETQLAATKAQLADVTEKYKNSQVQVQTLHSQLDAVNQQLASLKNSGPVDQNMSQLMSQNKVLTDKLAAAQQQIKALAGSPGSKAAKLIVQLKAVQDKLTETQAANQALTDTTNTLQSQLTQAQTDLAAANQKLATTAPGSAEYLILKRENEVMRGILTREIVEQSRRDGAKRIAQEEFDRLKINSKVLQEQLDILASPMVPPSSDEERTLIASLKAGNGGVIPPGNSGNQLTATTNGAPVQEGNPPVPVPPGVPPPSTTTTTTTTNAAANPSPSDTNTVASASTNAPTPAADTNVAPAAPASANPPSAPATNAAPASTPAVATDTNNVSATNAAPGVATTTNAAPPPAPATTTPPAVDTNTSAPAPAAASQTNAAPAPSVASSDTTPPAASTNSAPDNASSAGGTADPNRFSNKPRLPDDMREVAQEATDLFKMQRYDEAAAKYQTIIDKYPESLYAWSNLGVVRSQEGKLPEAQKALQQAVKLSPNDAFSYRNLGIVYYQQNQNDAAIDALERSIALDPNNVYSHDYLGCATSQKGWQEVAEKEFRKAIEINDDFPDAHYNLAIIYAMQKPPALELARRHYKRALELGLPKDMRLEKLLGL